MWIYSMWIDNLTSTIKVYENNPGDPFAKKMTWNPEEKSWVLFPTNMEKIAKFDPILAQCAQIVNDPEQTEALAKFAEGKMSYAEMRGLCG